MTVNIKINNFEGPFDLLLHLIMKNKMEVYDIQIYEITNQYLEYLREMETMDLEITSEFIVIAATLIELKSISLLPKLKVEEDLESEELDPKLQLIFRLIEYKKYKTAAEFLRFKEKATGLSYSKKPEIIEEKEWTNNYTNLFKNVTMLTLYNIFNELMNNFNNKQNTENIIEQKVFMDRFKLEDKIDYIKEILIINYRVYFSSLIKDCSSRMEAVVTFLALLELIKQRSIKILQENNFMEIFMERIDENEI